MGQVNAGVGGVKKASKIYAGVGGVVKEIKSGKCGVNGAVKTFYDSEILLYQGGGTSGSNGAAYNGAVVGSDYLTLEYSFPAGSLQDKNLVITFGNIDFDYYYAAGIYFDVTGTGAQDFYLKNGTCYESLNAIDTVWKAYGTYSYPISSLNYGNFAGITKFKIKFYGSKQTTHQMGLWCKELWIK